MKYHVYWLSRGKEKCEEIEAESRAGAEDSFCERHPTLEILRIEEKLKYRWFRYYYLDSQGRECYAPISHTSIEAARAWFPEHWPGCRLLAVEPR